LDLEDNSLTSGYKSETPRSPKSFARRSDDRFKTQTISKSDLSSHHDSDSTSSSTTNSNQNSPANRKTIRQKRQEEAERFKTQTISPANIIEEEAKQIVDIITESKSNARSRSASADGLLDSRILTQNDLLESVDLNVEQDLLKENIQKGPKITKPRLPEQESEPEDPEKASSGGIRGRRKALYSPKKINNGQQQPPVASHAKPAIAPKPRNILSNQSNRPRIPPGSPRGTRSTQLRQINKSKQTSPPSPKLTQRNVSRIRAPLASPANSTISSTSSSSSSSRLVRQGTFTKDESSSLNKMIVDIDVDEKKPPKRPGSSQSSHAGTPRGKSNVVIPQTRTSALRERSRSRQGSGSSTTSSTRSHGGGATSTSIPKPGMKQSPSNTSLGRRTPSSAEFKTNNISDTVSESAVTSAAGGKKTGKKEVTSKIASLWKKVEDSKKKSEIATKNKNEAKKVWISKGRVIPESDLAFLRPDEAQKKIIDDFQSKNNKESGSDKSPVKVRSKSRLSIKLSKFKSSSGSGSGFGLKKENSFTYTSHLHPNANPGGKTSTSVPSTPQIEQHPSQFAPPTSTSNRHSRIGMFLNPDEQKNSAIVPPFNYSPPNQQGLNKKPNNSGVKISRNDSYVSSMGRIRDDKTKAALNAKKPTISHEEEAEAPTSSVLVTLV